MAFRKLTFSFFGVIYGKGLELRKSERRKSKMRTSKVKNLSKDQNIKSLY
jgi:hypothetical protein